MNKGQVIGGIVCIAIATLLAVLSFTLPEGKVVFMAGGENIPMIPVIILAAVGFGLVLLGARGRGSKAS